MASLQEFIESQARTQLNEAAEGPDFHRALTHAREYTEELNVHIPSPAACDFISSVAGCFPGRNAIVISSASPVLSIHVAYNLGGGAVTVLEPEAETLATIKEVFAEAGLRPNTHRFLSTRRLDVLTRLADASYSFIYCALQPADMGKFVEVAWPLLHEGGTMILDNLLLDGTVGDSSRRDSNTANAREALTYIETLTDATISYVPLDGGLVMITKRAEAK
ncbi:MAG: hypothetical protein Q3962_00145 [Corynebacterium sp.]|nr:hypothetical protein [Corynebacterium sp.]